MKGFKFNFDNQNYEVYNETEGTLHIIKLKKNGSRCSPNAKTLSVIKKELFKKFLGTSIKAI